MDRNARTPGFVAHYRPAPPSVWLLAAVMLGLLVVGAAGYFVIVR